MLSPTEAAASYEGPKLKMTESNFRLMMNADPMATDKLAEGIRGFVADIEKLEKIIAERL